MNNNWIEINLYEIRIRISELKCDNNPRLFNWNKTLDNLLTSYTFCLVDYVNSNEYSYSFEFAWNELAFNAKSVTSLRHLLVHSQNRIGVPPCAFGLDCSTK